MAPTDFAILTFLLARWGLRRLLGRTQASPGEVVRGYLGRGVG